MSRRGADAVKPASMTPEPTGGCPVTLSGRGGRRPFARTRTAPVRGISRRPPRRRSRATSRGEDARPTRCVSPSAGPTASDRDRVGLRAAPAPLRAPPRGTVTRRGSAPYVTVCRGLCPCTTSGTALWPTWARATTESVMVVHDSRRPEHRHDTTNTITVRHWISFSPLQSVPGPTENALASPQCHRRNRSDHLSGTGHRSADSSSLRAVSRQAEGSSALSARCLRSVSSRGEIRMESRVRVDEEQR